MRVGVDLGKPGDESACGGDVVVVAVGGFVFESFGFDVAEGVGGGALDVEGPCDIDADGFVWAVGEECACCAWGDAARGGGDIPGVPADGGVDVVDDGFGVLLGAWVGGEGARGAS